MSNVGKYESSNPLRQVLLQRFLRRLDQEIAKLPGPILDVGIGEAMLWERIGINGYLVGIDVRGDALLEARRVDHLDLVLASVYELPFDADSFKACTAIEVFEHLMEPDEAASELARVVESGGLVTTPWEPWFSLATMFGGWKHFRRLGREFEHVQAFGPRDLESVLAPHFARVDVDTCFPWLVASVSH